MHYKNTVEALYKQIDEIQHLVANMGIDGKLHAIDIDLTMDKLRTVYDLLVSLKQESLVTAPDANTKNEELKNEVPDINEIETEEMRRKDVKLQVEKEEVEINEKVRSRVTEESNKKYLGDSFKKEKPTLHEELAQKKATGDISSKLGTKPISNIADAIGINEKFEFINSLFDGDKEKYSHTLNLLNAATNFNEAYNYLSSNFNWDMDNANVQKLLELIRRKLIVRK